MCRGKSRVYGFSTLPSLLLSLYTYSSSELCVHFSIHLPPPPSSTTGNFDRFFAFGRFPRSLSSSRLVITPRSFPFPRSKDFGRFTLTPSFRLSGVRNFVLLRLFVFVVSSFFLSIFFFSFFFFLFSTRAPASISFR